MRESAYHYRRRLRLAVKRGGALVVALVTLFVVGMIAGTLVTALLAAHRQSRRHHDQLQAQWLAEAGLARGLARLARSPDYQGETWLASVLLPEVAADDPRAAGQVTIRIEPAEAGPSTLVVVAIYPNHPIQRALVRRELELAPAAPNASDSATSSSDISISVSSGENR